MMSFYGFNLFNAVLMTSRGVTGIEVVACKVTPNKRRPWAVLDLMTSLRKKDWGFNLMVLGLWVSTTLVQPDWVEGEEIQLAKREWKFGFNFFQKVRMDAE